MFPVYLPQHPADCQNFKPL
ncbi:unconventional myosin-Vb-like, partial [Daubentonia madagascariensis]